ncbi:phosphatidylserine decarboxylase family protein [bacterium]|nr:phosphatidylserine decarboxylase family protein [bacterium]
MKTFIHREGYRIVLLMTLTALVFTLASLKLESGGLGWSLSVGLWLFTALCVFFFRDPERRTPVSAAAIVSPADGRVIGIDEVDEDEFLHGRARRVSIFMSVWNVHVNRAPVTGMVKYWRYQRGRFRVASLPAASLENEQALIGIAAALGRVLVKQIAGILARRVVCSLREGQEVQQGERFGIIKFGSRLEVLLPLPAEISVSMQQKVRAGETIIAFLREG